MHTISVKKTENTLGLNRGDYALFRTRSSVSADIAARIIRIVVGVPVAGSASVFWSIVVPVADPDHIIPDFGIVVFPVATITAFGLDGALSDAPARLTGTANSRMESMPALIVISVVDRAEVIVRT